jgi:spore cortex biosynthesis protein YabQ
MSPDIYIESAHIGYAVLWGLELAFFYDIIAVFRNMVTHKNIFIYAEDFLYWMFCALFVFRRLYEIGNGQMRWYMALGIGIGMLAYKLTISRYFVKGATFIVSGIFRFLGKILSFFFRPIRYTLKAFRKIFRVVKSRFVTIVRLLKKK